MKRVMMIICIFTGSIGNSSESTIHLQIKLNFILLFNILLLIDGVNYSCIHPCINLISKALRNQLIISNWGEFIAKIKEIFEAVKKSQQIHTILSNF